MAMEEKRMNVNDKVIVVWSLGRQTYDPQGSFGLGRHVRLNGIRISADPWSLSVFGVGSSRELGLVHHGSFLGSDVLRGWRSEEWNSFGDCSWGPVLKQGRPLDGGGSCLVWLASSPKEHPGFREAKPAVPPGLVAGRDTRLLRRGGCTVRGQVEPLDLEVTEFWSITAGALFLCSVAARAAKAGLSLAVIPCEAQEVKQCRLVLGKRLSSSGPATLNTSARRASGGWSSSLWVAFSELLLVSSLWPSVRGVFTSLPWCRCSLRQGLKGCSIWGCRKKEKIFK